MSEDSTLRNEPQSNASHPTVKAKCECWHELSPNAEKPGHQLGVASFSFAERSYYLVVIEGGSRDAFSFRGMSSKFTPNGFESEILNFHIKGPLIEMLADLGDFQEVGIRGGAFWPNASPPTFIEATGHLLLTPLRSCDGLNPHGALLWLRRSSQDAVTITLADFREGLNIRQSMLAIIFAACGTIFVPVETALLLRKEGITAEWTVKTKMIGQTFETTGKLSTGPGPAPQISGGH